MKRLIFLVNFAFASEIFIQQHKILKSITNCKNRFIKLTRYNPFINKSVKKIDNISIKIKMIVGNRVFINNKWYKIGDKIGNYTIYKIYDKYIIIKNNKIKKRIYFFKE